MKKPSKAAREAVERIAQRLRWGFFGSADREAMAAIIDLAIEEAAESLMAALRRIANKEPGSQGAYRKFAEAVAIAKDALAKAEGGS